MATTPKYDDPPPKYEPPPPGFTTGGPPPEAYPPQGPMLYGPPNPQQGQPYGQPYPAQGPPQQGHTTVIINQPQAVALDGATYRYAQYPALIVCQHCHATVTTLLNYETGLLTWAIAGGICLFGLWLGCCLIPFCIDATKDVEHRCPNCNHTVGKFRHF